LDELQAANQLEILKGRLKNIEPMNGNFNIRFSTLGEDNNLSADAIINCIGSESNFSLINFPLLKNLLSKGLVRTDSLKLGLDALPDGRTLDEFGSVSNKIYTIGTALKGVLWESTAMPEIRIQANRLALSLLEQQ
jgi:uncharacterized NAD(P)/FAD-binding protein YdhS